MEFSIVQIYYISGIMIVSGMALLVITMEKHLPRRFLRLYYNYGKYTEFADRVVSETGVPKRWYQHFYKFGATWSSFVAMLVVSKYIYKSNMPNFIYPILDLMFGGHRRASVSPETTLLATILLTIHCWKRLYESHCISIFSDKKINVIYYFNALLHYLFTPVCMIGESQGFVRGSHGVLHWKRVSTLQYFCAIVFLWATFEQMHANYILANLRKNEKGEVVTKSYKIPYGKLFEYISSPLQFTEILIYFMLSLIMWENSTIHYIFLAVLVNQIESGTLNHWWNLKTFEDYPKNRKIIIPYLL